MYTLWERKWGRWRGTEATPESTFSILHLQNCPPSNSPPLFSCSLTFGQMCLHQVDHHLRGFPVKSVGPVYWAPLLFLCQRDPFASLGEFAIILISWTLIVVPVHLNCFPNNSTYLFRFFFPLTVAMVGMSCLSFDLLLAFGFAVRSWSVLSEVGTTSTWLSPLSWVYCCGRTSPTDEDKPWVLGFHSVIPAWPVSRERTQVANARKKMMSFWKRKHRTLLVTLSQSKLWPQHIFTHQRSNSCLLNIM